MGEVSPFVQNDSTPPSTSPLYPPPPQKTFIIKMWSSLPSVFISAEKKQTKKNKNPSALGLFLVDFDSRQPTAGIRRQPAAHLLPARLFCTLEAEGAGPQSEGGVR